MATIKKAQNGFKSAIIEQTKRVNKRKNELTTGDLHTDPNISAAKQLGSKISRSAEKLLNPKGFKKESTPNKVLSAFSKKKNGGSIAKDGKWIQKATASIKKRGTAGKCTPITKPGCTGKAKTLALTFKKIAKAKKKK